MPIIQSISKRIQSLQVPFFIVARLNEQKKFIKKHINPFITEARQMDDDSLDDNDIKKITGYYGLAVPALLGEACCLLRGEPMTEKERLTSTCQGSMTGLGDDFFDRQRLSEQGVKDFIENPGRFNGNTASEKLFLYFYKTALANAPQPELMQQQLFRVFYAQLLSKQQDAPGLSFDVINDITIRKGAESLLYYRTAFDHPLKSGEEKMLFGLGGLMQLSNDIFDVYKDRQAGVHTLVTTTGSIQSLRLHYQVLLQLSTESAFRSGYSNNHVRKFLGLLNLGIFARCLVCLDQLEQLEKKSGGIFELHQYSRKDLICDMDTAGNKFRSLRYHIKLARKFK